MKREQTMFRVLLSAFCIAHLICSEKSFGRPLPSKTPDPVFATMAVPGNGRMEAVIWTKSIRRFAGKYRNSPVWVFVHNGFENLDPGIRQELAGLDAEVIPVPVEEQALNFPLAAKVFAAAAAESLASSRDKLLVWMDPDNLILREPSLFALPPGIALGYRPVQHKLIGSEATVPADEFWQWIYTRCRVPESRIFNVTTPVDNKTIRLYINAGHMVVRPEKGLLRLWRDNFRKLYGDSFLRSYYQKSPLYAVFIHQAVLSASAMSALDRTEMVEFPLAYNYPLMLYSQIPADRRIPRLNDVVTARFDAFSNEFRWRGSIRVDEPLRTWVDEQFRMKGITTLLVMNRNFGSSTFLNREEFERLGWNMRMAGVEDTLPPCRYLRGAADAPAMAMELRLQEMEDIGFFDAVALMPSTAVYQKDPFREIMDNPRAMENIRAAVLQGVPFSTICSGARVLAAADLVRGKSVVAHPGFKEEYERAGAVFLGNNHAPMAEGNLITGARDRYYDFANTQALAGLVEKNLGRGKHRKKPAHPFVFSEEGPYAPDSTVVWSRTIGGLGNDGARWVAATSDGGFVLAGYTFSHGSGDPDMLVVKTDVEGKLVWTKSFGGAGAEYANHVLVLDDGYLVTGYTTSFGAGSRDVCVIKLDGHGQEVWTRTFGGKNADVGSSTVAWNKDGIVVVGYTGSSGAGEEDVYLLKLDWNGKMIWSRTFGGTRSEIGNSVVLEDDGSLFVSATTGTFGGNNCDFLLACVGPEGDVRWTKAFGSNPEIRPGETAASPFDGCRSMAGTPDGGFVLAGHSAWQDIMDFRIVKSDVQGNELWTTDVSRGKTFDFANSVISTRDQGFVMVGTATSCSGKSDLFVVKLDSLGRTVRERALSSRASAMGQAVCETQDGNVVVAGQANPSPNGGIDMVLVKMKIR